MRIPICDSRPVRRQVRRPWTYVLLTVIASVVILLGLLSLAATLSIAAPGYALPSPQSEEVEPAEPIEPPEGYPKFNLASKTVTPTLAATGVVTLTYTIEISNTGAYTATDATLADVIPDHTTYNGDAWASVDPQPTVTDGTLTWAGEVGFDSAVVVGFSVTASPTFSGTVRNSAVISHPLIARPVTVTAETVVTDDPILAIDKTSTPSKPGANKPLFYDLSVTNWGQPATNLPITVTDHVPLSTTLRSVGIDGFTSPVSDVVTWTRQVNLDLGQSSLFTFSVDVNNVASGTVIANENYDVASQYGLTAGELYTVTVIDPILLLSKHVWPDPPGSNREMIYTLTLLNTGSWATDLIVTDRVPAGVTYVGGGAEASGVISWSLPSLNTGETAEFTFTVDISDVMGIAIVNDDYMVCCAEGVCQPGVVLTSVVQGPTFEAMAILYPIAKKPGGGGGPVTPTLVVHNLGPGNAISATALLEYRQISVSNADVITVTSSTGMPKPLPVDAGIPDCSGGPCNAYLWVGNVDYGETITFTTIEGQSTIGGEEGNIYTATVVITDSLTNTTTEPITATATGKVTHYAELNPTKSTVPVIRRGQLMTYTITVWNSALSTEEPPSPWLTDTVPTNTTVVSVSNGGVTQTLGDLTVISWTLPAMSPGDRLYRSFSVRVDNDLVSGTQIINNDYRVYWYESEIDGGTVLSNTGQPVTTTVREVGLIDSYKEVTPTVALPEPGKVLTLTYYVHIVNSSEVTPTGVTVYDFLPWQSSTYQRNAVASAGQIISDIVSVSWTGDVAAFSSEVVTFTVLVDPDYQGPITNTAVISHPDLLSEVEVQAIAYITEQPVLHISKSASPDPVEKGAELKYTISVVNLSQRATNLVISDTLPADTVYVEGSTTGNGQLVDDQMRWEILELKSGDSHTFEFRVTVEGQDEVVNDRYGVRCAEGVVGVGAPLVTPIKGVDIYLPLILKQWP